MGRLRPTNAPNRPAADPSRTSLRSPGRLPPASDGAVLAAVPRYGTPRPPSCGGVGRGRTGFPTTGWTRGSFRSPGPRPSASPTGTRSAGRVPQARPVTTGGGRRPGRLPGRLPLPPLLGALLEREAVAGGGPAPGTPGGRPAVHGLGSRAAFGAARGPECSGPDSGTAPISRRRMSDIGARARVPVGRCPRMPVRGPRRRY